MEVPAMRRYLGSLQIPTQITRGDRDQSYKFDQIQALWRGIPDCSLAVIPNAPHAAQLEQPDIFCEVMRV